jgi:tetratricopeptide (TPR) repeat protein
MAGVEEAQRALLAADEAYARFDVEGVVAHLSTAIRGLTAAGEPRAAAMACVQLGETLANGLGNLTAGRAWFARATRLVEDEPPCLEQGWVAVAEMGCDVADPATLLAAAELALDRARRFGDVNLETKALADAGLAHVQAGRVAEGMALLDEAMALACGPADDGAVAAKSACSFFTACYYATDFGRAGSWADLMRQHGLIGVTPGGPAFLSSHCDSVQATLLAELGRWGDAEAVLVRAKADFEARMPAPAWHPDIALADLRIRQGRLADAEALLLGKDQAMQALLPAARLHLARGDHDLARATALRGLRSVGDDRLRAVELLTVLVHAELTRGDLDAARRADDDLLARTGDLEIPALQARTAATHARVLVATGAVDEAIAVLEHAVDRLDVGELPWRRVTLLVDLARLRDQVGDAAGARLDAAAALGILAGLDVVLPAEDHALLARLYGGGGSAAARTVTLAAEGKWWVVADDGTSVRLRDSKGLRYLAELVGQPNVERHALDLVDRIEGVDVDEAGAVDRRALGNAGDLLDAQARATYRRRIEQLRAEADDAIAEGRLDAAEALQEELDQLVRQLAQAFGLGGRSRQAASAAERARLNVTRALRSAIARVAEAMPDAGAALDRQVRTGLYCVYEPADDPIRVVFSPE